ncbi:hypothetical protein SAMN02745824_3361 [Parasphingorhabdus marina DSM 22363]|uniref:Uncharacterized protein n=1 Tax=Parasphingorhabdus marina DSM 22363 TaxID=1123272 RepID=A0A1N6HMR6_9SPHN|nr:hypothetical protein [Parasphingorhabdus marina]SIO20945.1 hypothetical protein SAMN02745824_3361 [Parasphingorhabdus marina DSM 22363]
MSGLFKTFVTATAIATGSAASAAGGWTDEAVPARVEIVRDQGILIFGDFGNPGPNPCASGNAVWVPKSHSEYTEVLSSALAAVAGQLKLKFYVHYCATVGWHGSDYNQYSAAGAMFISR